MFRAAVILLALIAVPAPGRADAPIVYARGSSVWVKIGSQEATSLIGKPAGRDLRRIDRAARANSLVLETGTGWLWVDASKTPATKRELKCTTRPVLSQFGRCIACRDKAGRLLVYVRGKSTALEPKVDGSVVAFAGSDSRLVADRGDALWEVATRSGRSKRKLAPHRPSKGLSVAPDGRRAVGLYEEGDRLALYSFLLDGRAARRRLMAEAVPVTWSDDSQWLLVQMDKAACSVRATGGQYKCWDGYDALSLSADGRAVLLGKKDPDNNKTTIYRATTLGPRAAKPVEVIRGAGSWATWLRPLPVDDGSSAP